MAGAGDAYAGAGQHYTSPGRRDWVKRAWEEPAAQRHLDAALRRAHALGVPGDVDVLDVGCGTGVGLDLLLATPAIAAGPLRLARATGLDLDEGLLAIARGRYADDGRITFVTGDLASPPATGPHDLVVSSGVPFSHLTPDELEHALGRLIAVALAGGTGRTVLLVVDVLGRYSLEWTTRWDRVRWDYRMSFFVTDTDVPSTPMTTWGGADLAATIRRAAGATGTTVADLTLVDRSLAVGRHTMTGEYTPGLPRLRDLVDALAAGDTAVDPATLRIDLALPAAPDDVLAAHAAFARAWNTTLEEAVRTGSAPEALADRLREVESGHEHAGLGLGHSLTAFVVLTTA
jgi:SAM-dependent methyltransferase